MIKHKWKQVETQKDDDQTHKCTVCGCTRHKRWYGGPHPDFLYVRNGIVFSEGRPDCYDDNPPFQHAMGHFN